MKLTKEEYQKLIDDENWEELSKTDIIKLFDYGSNYVRGVYFKKSFITDFLLVEKYFYSAFNYIGNYFFADEVYMHIQDVMQICNIKLSPEEWKKWIEVNIKYRYEKGRSLAGASEKVIEMTRKDSNYILALFDDQIYEKVLDFKNYSKIFIRHKVSLKSLEGLTDYQIIEGIKRLKFDKNTSFEFDFNIKFFSKFFSDPIDLIKLNNELKLGNPSDLLQDLTPEQYIDAFKKYLYDPEIKKDDLESWGDYFFNYKPGEYQLSDEIFQKIIDIVNEFNTGFLLNAFVNAMSLEQINKYRSRINVRGLVLRKDIPLDKINEILHNHERINLIAIRFFTEEEIAAGPHFFHPDYVLRYNNFYVSRETFKLLNRAWKKKARYNESLTDFKRIFKGLSEFNMYSRDSIEYLIKKCNVSNEEFISTLSKSTSSINGNDNFILNINTFSKFLKIYGQ